MDYKEERQGSLGVVITYTQASGEKFYEGIVYPRNNFPKVTIVLCFEGKPKENDALWQSVVVLPQEDKHGT